MGIMGSRWLCGVVFGLFVALLVRADSSSIIQCDNGWIQVPSRTTRTCAVTQVAIDNLFETPTITFRSMNDEIVYTKAHSKLWELSEQVSWFGVLTSREGMLEGSATFFENQGDLVGTFSSNSTSYTLKKTVEGTFQVEAIALSYLLSSEVPSDVLTLDGNFDRDSASRFSGSLAQLTLVEPIKTVGQPMVSTGSGAMITMEPSKRQLQGIATVDVLWVVTNRAYCEQASSTYGCTADQANIEPMNLQISLEVIKMNDALASASAGAVIQTVGTLFISDDPQFDFDTNLNTAGSNDGLEYLLSNSAVRDFRDELGADLVHLITSGSGPKGIATLNGYASVANRNAFPVYAVQHVLGHNFGCRHDRRNEAEQSGSAFGYTVDDAFYTIMGYANTCSGNCVLVPFFSENGASVTLPGGGTFPLGTPNEDNASQLRSAAPSVAALKTRGTGPGPTPNPNGPPTVQPANSPPPTMTPPSGNTPSPSRRPAPTPSGPSFGANDDGTITIPLCFSSENTVFVRGKGSTPIEDLQIGDYVETSSGQFSRVYSFAHKDPSTIAEYLRIYIGDNIIEISGEHILFTRNNAAMLAKDIKVGDYVGEDLVVKVETVKRRGLFAPLTESGSVQVSGVRASCYVNLLSLDPSLQTPVYHAVLSPLRLLCRFGEFCEREKYTKGISNRVAWPIWFALIVKQYTSSTIQSIGVLALCPLFFGLSFVEHLVLNPVLLLVLLLSFKGLRAAKKR